ncbi:MAG: Arsenite methyltransferase [Ignavibacteria bacterium]|nr:Arsenite methyltransferase [Ignavibacteria bacterium]
MKTKNEIKSVVKEKYGEIALQSKETNESSCCGSSCCSDETYNIMSDEYKDIEGYNPDADLGLGCGLPTKFAEIKKGDTVIDLGSGAGNDCFIAASETGDTGKVIGIDFTESMIEKANRNLEKSGLKNIEFRLGDIENMPAETNTADVVISNCVLNLVPDKEKVFKEIFRVLKTGGHFSISDIVLQGQLPESIRQAGEMYAGCISGAIEKDAYKEIIKTTGFKNLRVQSEKAIILPDDILKNYLNPEEIENYKQSNNRIISITVYAEK